MKKTLQCMLIFLFVLSFSACASKVPTEIVTHIDSPFTATMGDLSLEGLLIYTADQEMYVDISTPDELYGLSYSWEDNFTVGYRGLNAVTESDYLPPSSFAQALKNTLDDILLNKPALQSADNGFFTATGKTDSGCYKILTDRNGFVKEIEIIGCDIKLMLSQ